ncbi:CDP-archaeol synthase [Candidatus Bilamarchaeum dharawalense]|uniref:CDP-archaeol synthase n=1 Tax=Candidatus Bilamarchaeum dharawalense TaxID=2885759 RepID=A0A5E4LND2_9ARCH|nr:CDP-archaeol synthase [Candidatus Bilamarchaeum dharawalense]
MTILDLLIFLIPIYIANSSPVVLGGGMPLDLGYRLGDNKRIFGDGKTIRGFIGGTLAGTVAGALVANYYQLPFFADARIQFMAGFALALGTLCGDACGSFIKRRFGVDSGKPFLLDTMMFIIIALVFVTPFAKDELFTPLNLLFFLVLTVILHPLANMLANRVGLKKVPW